MASFIINEEKFINDNIFKYEERATSPLTRFLDKAPTFVTYYHINNDESTTDGGFHDVESIVGSKSPIKFQKIDNFPVYGLEAVMLSLSHDEQGLDTSHEGELVILPNTIKPLPNDFFMINHVNDCFVFKITEISFDSIRADNFYKVSYKFEYIDEGKVEQLEDQVHEKFNCVLGNIGTEQKCIIREDFYDHLIQINSMYDSIVNLYKDMYYSERHNCFISDYEGNNRIFDPFQSMFCNAHSLFNKKNDFNTLILSTQFNDAKRQMKYQKSMYRFIEEPRLDRMGPYTYFFLAAGSNQITTFYRWYERNILMLDITLPICRNTGHDMFSNEFIEYVQGEDVANMSVYAELIKKHIRKELNSVFDIPTTIYEDLVMCEDSTELFFYTPIILYIIKTVTENFLKQQ